jgi:hypothetical protein
MLRDFGFASATASFQCDKSASASLALAHDRSLDGLKRKFLDCLETGKAANSSIKGADVGLYYRIAALEALPSLRELFN